MRVLAVVLAVLLAWPAAGATEVVSTDHVRVLFDDPALGAYARRVAQSAEVALTRVAALFGRPPLPVVVRVRGDNDAFNAIASTLPRPNVEVRALYPVDGAVGFRSDDPLALVLRHELTHLIQLTDTRTPSPGGAGMPDVGLVGHATAALPPAWLLEGIAVWVESGAGDGGRLHDARTRTLLRTLALGGDPPTLADVSLTTYAAWPGGEARYLIGGAFVADLVRRHGFGALEGALHAYQATGGLAPFADAWRATVGTDLKGEWRTWWAGVAEEALGRTDLSEPRQPLTQGDGRRGLPAASPSGSRLAWAEADGVHVARLQASALSDERTFSLDGDAHDVAWLDERTVAVAAVMRDPAARPSDLLAVDVDDGTVRRLTHGAHAHLPRPEGNGCVLYVRDTVVEGSSLERACPTPAPAGPWSTWTVWRAPEGEHLVGLSGAQRGRLVLSLEHGGQVDLWLLDLGLLDAPVPGAARAAPRGAGPDRRPAALRRLTSGAGPDLDPVWDGPGTLLFSRAAGGAFQVMELTLPSGGRRARVARLTALIGGGRGPVPVAAQAAAAAGAGAVAQQGARPGPAAGSPPCCPPGAPPGGPPGPPPGAFVVRTLGARGELFALERASDGVEGSAAAPLPGAVAGRGPAPASARGSAPASAPAPAAAKDARGVPAVSAPRPYTPWSSLAPYGWLPLDARVSFAPAGAGAEAAVLALDDSEVHALSLHAGYDTSLEGPLAGAYAWLRYGYRWPELVPRYAPAPIFSAEARVGLWPHLVHLEATRDTAWGVRVGGLLRAPLAGGGAGLALAVALVDAPALPGPRAEASLDGSWDARRGDPFGAPSGGGALALRGRWTAGEDGPSAGLWLQGRWYPEIGPVTLLLGLDGGYRPAPPVPLDLPAFALVASAGARASVKVAWRWSDGLVALERLDIEPNVRIWGGVDATRYAVGVGADLGVWGDAVLQYEAPVRLGVRAGYADGWWMSLALSTPF